MDKKFKEVRNVLNMKKIISAGVLVGTLFASTSAFAAEPNGVDQQQETTKYSFQDRVNKGLIIKTKRQRLCKRIANNSS